MKTGLFILPFLALLSAAIGGALGSAATQTWVKLVGLGLGVVLLGLWVFLDFKNFKHLFARKGAKYGASSGLVVVLGICVVVGLALLTSRPRFNKSIDVSKSQANTLSDQSLKILENVSKNNATINVTAFFQDDGAKTQFRDLANLYQNKAPNIAIEYVDPARDPMRAQAEKLTSGNTVIFRFGKQESRVTTFTEEKLTNALVKVLKDKVKKVYFVKGHGEGELKGQDANGLGIMAQELENNNYQVAELKLLEEGKVPADADLLVIAGPKYDLKEEEVRFVEDYLKQGGALFALVGAVTPVDNFNNMLGKFGINFDSDILILSPNDPRAMLLGQNNAIVSEFDDLNPVTKDFAKKSQVDLLLQFTRSLTEKTGNTNNMKVSLVAKTAPIVIKVKDVRSQADLGRINKERIESGTFAVIAVASGKPASPDLAKAEGDKGEVKKDAGSEGLDGNKKRETRIVAVGSPQLATNQGAQAPQHRDMFLNSVSYLMQDEDFISIRPKDPTKTTVSLTSKSSQFGLLALSFIYPFLFAGAGLFYWLRRRRA